MKLVFNGAACLAMATLLAPAAEKKFKLDRPIGPDMVWQRGTVFLRQIHDECDTQPQFAECAAREIENSAPAEAAAFARVIDNDGWMRDFRKVGRVDIAYVLYPFRANENNGWLLVNGSPAMVDVDELSKLPRAELKTDPAWLKIAAKYPKAFLFADDRSGSTDPLALVFADGSQQFVVSYRITDGCRACAVLGFAFFGFDFNPKGKLAGVRLLQVHTAPEGEDARVRTPARPVSTRSGQSFSVVLKREEAQGFHWSVDQPPSDTVARVAGTENTPGSQILKFEVTGAGNTQATLRYASETSSEDGQVLTLQITASPGLRR